MLEFLPPADKACRGAADTDALRRRPLAQEERGVFVAEAPEQVFPVVAPAATATSPAHPDTNRPCASAERFFHTSEETEEFTTRAGDGQFDRSGARGLWSGRTVVIASR